MLFPERKQSVLPPDLDTSQQHPGRNLFLGLLSCAGLTSRDHVLAVHEVPAERGLRGPALVHCEANGNNVLGLCSPAERLTVQRVAEAMGYDRKVYSIYPGP